MIGFSYEFLTPKEVFSITPSVFSMGPLDLILVVSFLGVTLSCIFLLLPSFIVARRIFKEKKQKKNKKKLLQQILLQKEIEDEVENEIRLEEVKS